MSSGHGLRTSIYRQSRSAKLVIMVVMKGWPATAESVFRSFLICSTCFKRMTVEVKSHRSSNSFATDSLSTLRSIFRAKTFCPSFEEPAKRDSHTRAKVPGQTTQMEHSNVRIGLTGPNGLDELKVAHSQLFGREPNLFAARMLGNLIWRERRPITLEACNKVLLLLLLFLVNWFFFFVGQIAAVGTEQFRAVRGVEVGSEFGGCHLDALQAKTSLNNTW